jgi:ABC-type amino acid transport system permease subunit
MNPLAVLWEYRSAFWAGFLVTAQLLLLSSTLGTILALVLEWLCGRLEGLTRWTSNAIAFCLAAIPALVILFWFHYPAQALLGIVVPPFFTALLTLTLINTLAIYRIVGDAIREFPKQYIATGLVCGLLPRQILWHIQIPILVRAVLPRWIDQQVFVLHTTLLASFISVEESFRVAQRINSVVYQPVAIYTSMALIFLFSAGSAMYYANFLRRKFQRDFSER